MTIDSTATRIEPRPTQFEMFAGGSIAAVICFSVGVFLLVVPVVGWIVGPSLMLTAGLIALAHAVGLLQNRSTYKGRCPYCGAPVTAGDPGSMGRCGACKHRFEHSEGQFLQSEQ